MTTGIRLDALDEAALRLRNLGAWDNKLADALQLLRHQIRSLEQFAGIYQAGDSEGRLTKIETWDDFEQRMDVLLAYYSDCGARFRVSTADFIQLSRLSGHWRKQEANVPTTLRIAQFGMIVVGWEKPGCSLLLDKGTIQPLGKDKHFEKHNLTIS